MKVNVCVTTECDDLGLKESINATTKKNMTNIIMNEMMDLAMKGF